MGVYPGRKGVVYLGTTGGSVASAVLNLSKWGIDQSTDKIDVTSFLDQNKTYVQGLADVKGNFSGFWNDLEDKPALAARSAAPVPLYLYPSADAPGKYKCGPAWLDYSMETAVDGAVTISGEFVAGGSWALSTI